MITAAIVALDIIVHHGTSGDDWSDSSGNNKGRRREWRWSYVPRWSPRIASNRINRPPQRSEHAGMNPMSLIVVLCSKLRRPAPIRRRARATAANTSPWRRNCSARPIARLKVGARLETSLERVASGAAVTSPRAARFICASSSAAIGWSWGGPWATSGANEPQVGAKQNAGGCFAHWAGSVKEPAPFQGRSTYEFSKKVRIGTETNSDSWTRYT